jgi:Uma2 family endonuclease
MATVIEVQEATAPPLASEPERLYEVVGTQIVEKPPMGRFEATFASYFFEFLGPFARGQGLGQFFVETLFDLRPAVDRSRRPDLSFVSVARWPIDRRAPPGGEAWPMIPDLAVEVISPTNTATEVFDKVREYLASGTRLVWVVYPLGAEIEVYDAANPSIIRRLTRADVLDGGDVLPGFRLELATLFAEGEAPAG